MTAEKSPRKSLVSNFLSLSAVQFAGYVIPLITVPYLFRTIGTDRFGLLALSAAFGAYVQLVPDYGFNLFGIREVSKSRNEQGVLMRIVSEIMSAKILLSIVCVLGAAGAIIIVPRFQKDWAVYALTVAGVVGATFMPSWYFQGIERMRILAVLNLSSRLGYLILMFVFVKQPEDFIMLLVFSAATSWAATLVGVLIMSREVVFNIGWRYGISVIRTGFGIFTTQFWAVILQVSSVLVLGFYADNKEVGIYAAAEKIAKACIFMGIPICSSIFPRSSLLFQQSSEMAVRFLKKSMLLGGVSMVGVSILLFLFAPAAAAFVLGHPSPDVVVLIRILSALPFTIFLDNIYGTQILLNIHKEKQVIRAVAISAIFTVVCLVSLIPFWGPVGAAVSYLASESLVLVLMAAALWRAGYSPMLNLRNCAAKNG
jgi:PST family polysaccharide transporter